MKTTPINVLTENSYNVNQLETKQEALKPHCSSEKPISNHDVQLKL